MLGFDNATLQYFMNKLKEKFVLKSLLSNKIDKDGNKVLTTNDYTNEHKQILNAAFDDVALEMTENKEVVLIFLSNGVEVGRVTYKC